MTTGVDTDTLAVAWAGSGADGIAALHGLATRQGGAADSSLWALLYPIAWVRVHIHIHARARARGCI